MSNIQKLAYPYFTDGSTQLNAETLNPIIAKMNEMIEVINSGMTPTSATTYDSDAQAIMNRYTKSLSTTKKDAFNTFIVTLKNADIYSKIDYLILPCLANDTTEAVQNALDGVAFLTNPTSLTLANNGIKPTVGEAVCKSSAIVTDVTDYHVSFFNNDSAQPLSGKWDEAISGSGSMLGIGKAINATGVGVYWSLTTGGENKSWNPTGFNNFKETAKTHVILTINTSRMLLSCNGTQATKDDDTVVAPSSGKITYQFGQAMGVPLQTYREVTSETAAFGGGSFFTYGLLTIGKALTDAQCTTFNTAVTTLMNVILA